jgi:hypothetical protein
MLDVTSLGACWMSHQEFPVSAPAEQSQPLDLASRLERWALRFARGLDVAIRLVAFILLALAWLLFGAAVWLVALVIGVLILMIVIVSGLLLGYRVDRVLNRFLQMMSFWPDGLTTMTQVFWSQPQSRSVTARIPDSTGPVSHVLRVLQGIYVCAVAYLVVCLILRTNPLAYVSFVPVELYIGVGVLISFALAYAVYLDHHKPRALMERANKEATVPDRK